VNLAPKDYFGLFRKPQNFLKHAKDDPDGTFRGSIADTEALLMAAVMNAGELDGLSPAASLFQLWYIAKYRSIFAPDFEPGIRAVELFPGMGQMTATEQRAFGARRLREEYEQIAHEAVPAG
jgi:hypothetical protein